MVVKRYTLKEILVNNKLLTEETFEKLKQRAKQLGKHVEQAIIDTETLSKQQLLQALSKSWDVKAVDIETIDIDEDAARMVPETTARRYLVLPFARTDGILYTAMANPGDLAATEDLHLRTNYEIRPYLAMPDDINKGLSEIFSQDSKITDYISAVTKSGGGEIQEDAGGGREEITMEKTGEDDEKKARKLANGIILEALSREASDIHIEPFEKHLQVRYRCDGRLEKSSFNISKSLLNAILARIKIMSKTMDITEKRKPQDGRIQISYKDKPIEFRVNIIPTAYGESCVMRVLDRSSIMVDLPKLGFLPDTLKKFKSVLEKPYGIILVCGPTGSGKSTTLYSSLNYIIEKSKITASGDKLPVSPEKILTAENPVEYDLGEVVQLSINPDIGLDFASALRAFLRQDPDIIMVGEIRDRETAQIAMEAAMTGHLVLSTIHTNSAPGAVSRLAEMNVPRYLISSTIETVLAQRLVRTVCKSCKTKLEKIPAKLQEEFNRLNIPAGEIKPMVGKGCKECGDSGYKGRSGIHEILVFDEGLRKLLLEQIASGPISRYARENGMRPLWDDGIMKIAQGITTYEELLRVSQ
ncbi:MAG: ATPase, T2SS/T4P/T4SS family [Elusimicrobiota bacterium]|nr:ATPase, T2SS/T4P/T4SS family [Elusimicrobiota bacterium]